MKTLLSAGALVLAFAVLGPVYLGSLSPVNAQEQAKPPCQTVADLEAATKAAGAKIVGGASYDGDVTDSLVVIQTATRILLVGVKNGCVATDPLPLDGVKAKTGA